MPLSAACKRRHGDFCPNDEDGPWAPDHIHLSALGNELYAIGIAEALGVRALQR
jgi:hypothetical protein